VFVAFVVQQANLFSQRGIILSSVACMTVPYFSNLVYLINGTIFGKKAI